MNERAGEAALGGGKKGGRHESDACPARLYGSEAHAACASEPADQQLGCCHGMRFIDQALLSIRMFLCLGDVLLNLPFIWHPAVVQAPPAS